MIGGCMAYAYLIWLGLCVALPLALLWWRFGRSLNRHGWALGWTTVGGLTLGWLWNSQAIRVGIWYYTRPETLGVWVGGLPLEEWLWMGGVSLMFAALTIVLKEHTQTQPPSDGISDRAQKP